MEILLRSVIRISGAEHLEIVDARCGVFVLRILAVAFHKHSDVTRFPGLELKRIVAIAEFRIALLIHNHLVIQGEVMRAEKRRIGRSQHLELVNAVSLRFKAQLYSAKGAFLAPLEDTPSSLLKYTFLYRARSVE